MRPAAYSKTLLLPAAALRSRRLRLRVKRKQFNYGSLILLCLQKAWAYSNGTRTTPRNGKWRLAHFVGHILMCLIRIMHLNVGVDDVVLRLWLEET